MRRTFVMVSLVLLAVAARAGERTRVEVVFSGGHETDRRDRGRPVALVAGALGAPAEAFREAFKGVRPSRNGPPTGDEARRNKSALLGALRKYGVTNERLDEVSNRYRYRPQEGETWPNAPAKAFAIVEKGRIVRFEVVDAGFGYSSPPTVRVPGYEGVVQAKLAFDKKFEKNGSVGALSIVRSGR